MSNVNWSVSGTGSTGQTSGDNYVVTVGSTAFTVTCTANLSATPEGSENPVTVDGASQTTDSIAVLSAQAAFEAAAKKVTYNGRKYAVTGSSATVYYFEESFDASKLGIEVTGSAYSNATLTHKADNTYTVKASNADNAPSVEITINSQKTTPTVSITPGFGANSPIKGHTYTMSANYANTYNSTDVTAGTVKYVWTVEHGGSSNSTSASTSSTFNWKPTDEGSYKITCTVTEGSSPAATHYETYTVVAEPYQAISSNDGKTTLSLTPDSNTVYINTPRIQSKTDSKVVYGTSDTAPNTVTWKGLDYKDSSDSKVVKISGHDVTGLKKGTAKVIATVEFRGAEYTVEYTINVTSLDADTSSVTNGDEIEYTQRELKNLLEDAIDDVYSSFSSNDITIIKLVENASGYLTLKDDSTTLRTGNSIDGTLTIAAKKGYIGDATFKLIVNNRYTVTLTVRVDGDKDIKDTVTGTSANKSVTFTNSDYDSLYIYEGSSFKTEKYDGDWSKTSGHTDWKLVSKNKDYTVSTSAFDKNGKATLYVVAVDDGIASTGTITVSQKSYDINYNVVAGKSVSFSQKDFEDFLEDYAEDDGKYNPKKDDISFDHAVLTSSVPSTKNEGTLYYGSTEITSSNKSKTDMTDMDKVSFDTVSKPSKDTVSLTFRVYGEIEKPNSKKPDKVNYDVNVVISVVKEDITYTVGIDDTVQLTARDFVNFLQDARTSYRKAELDYVKFDVSGKNVSSYAYGGLYRSYSSYSTGKLADSTDKFYYEPSRTQYDLADVAYHTTRWAEAGKTVYIPFTVYGTKGEEASGTMAITIAQTMNFIDVKASDFFYEPVKWAVNNKITNGTSSTTFSPYKNCNRAEIVTFLWRAAKSPEPTITRNPFSDVQSVRDASYYKAILWASQNGITAGTTATTFSPYQECTRSQIVTFLYRYAKATNTTTYNPFKDVSSVNEASYYNAILWAVGKGITQGTSTTTFSPYASCTRGEAVTFLYRYVNGVK
ncbi:S-layer homology domain-containing protein [Oscillibacter sp. ER4]|uniref:S-layer homology domain-containing protein n=1 Tax=Oscillibacter sp. ER4 TaxID=1519439 RepID=UPI0018CE1360|nr:S-layer homology domain-containing protein [Oscillibacter sp. ER4]